MSAVDQAGPELHRLKVDVKPMSDLLSGNKTCEIRRDDRGFEVGDHVHLTCSDGRETDRIISHIQRGYGLPGGLCVLPYRADLAAPSAPVEVAGLDVNLLHRMRTRSSWQDCKAGADALEAAHAASAAKDAEIARLTGERDLLKNWQDHHATEAPRLKMQLDAATARAERAGAALAESEAKLTVAYETAAQVAAYLEPDEGQDTAWDRGYEQACRDKAEDIRALATEDQTAALAAYVKQHVEAETRAWIKELALRRSLLNSQTVALDIAREDAVYGICIDALSARLNQPAEGSTE